MEIVVSANVSLARRQKGTSGGRGNKGGYSVATGRDPPWRSASHLATEKSREAEKSAWKTARPVHFHFRRKLQSRPAGCVSPPCRDSLRDESIKAAPIRIIIRNRRKRTSRCSTILSIFYRLASQEARQSQFPL